MTNRKALLMCTAVGILLEIWYAVSDWIESGVALIAVGAEG